MAKLTSRRIIAGTLVVLGVLVVFFLITHFLHEITLIFMGVVLSISIAPAVDFLHRHRLNRQAAVVLIYLGALGLMSLFILLVLPQMAQQMTRLAPRFEALYESLKSSLQTSGYSLLRQWSSSLPASLNAVAVPTNGLQGGTPLGSLNSTLAAARSILILLYKAAIILLIGLFWTLEGERAEYAFSLLFPVEKRENTRTIVQDIEARVGGFVRGQGLLALAIGTMVLAGYSLIGLPSVISLAILAGFCELIPVFGPTLGAIPAILLAFASNPVKALWVIPVTIFLQLFENHVLAPQIMKKAVNVNPIVTILSITAFGYLLGFAGLLIAIPLAAIFQVILDRSVLNPGQEALEEPAGRDRLSKLHLDTQEFVQDVRKLVRRKEVDTNSAEVEEKDVIEDSIEAIATDLDDLLKKSIEPEEKTT